MMMFQKWEPSEPAIDLGLHRKRNRGIPDMTLAYSPNAKRRSARTALRRAISQSKDDGLARVDRLVKRRGRADAHIDRGGVYATTLNHMSQGVCRFDSHARIVVCNDAYLNLYSLSRDVVKKGCSLKRLIEHRRDVGLFQGDVDHYVAKILADVATGKILSQIGETRDGRIIYIVNQPMPDGGWVVTHEDITERSHAERTIAHMAHHDPLTDLANRAKFCQTIEYELSMSRRSVQSFALLILDLDGFKNVNDLLGHPVGDELLRAVAERLRKNTAECDTVARLGGDEFAIIQMLRDDAQSGVSPLTTRLIAAIGAPFEIRGHRVTIGVSAGVAIGPHDGETIDRLMANADLALYRAKNDGRNTFRFFEPAMDKEARSRHALETELRHAIARGQLEVHYQTIFNAEIGSVCGAEALLRWRHPEYGMVGPDKFIPIAEKSGLISSIGEWVLKTACLEATKWPDPLRVAVNLSPVQFEDGRLVSVIESCLAETGLTPERLEVEITESVVLHSTPRNLEQLKAIKALGVSVALDDFGTGYSSLSYLRSFPFDVIKIDRSFVVDISTRDDCASIIGAVIGLGKSLGLRTVAEGVENAEQFSLLRDAGCSFVQGYMFSMPRAANAVDFSPMSPQLATPSWSAEPISQRDNETAGQA